jgi:hypothetical protein
VEVIAKFQTLQVNKSMLDALHVQVQARKEKLEGAVMEFGVLVL